MVGLASLLLWAFGYSYLFRGIRLSYLKGYTSANIYDGRDFDTHTVGAGSKVADLPHAASYNKQDLPIEVQRMLEETGTASFLILHQDSLVFEKYYLSSADTTRTNSFSMAKTVITMLVQMAIEEGKIPGWETPAKTYLPWLEGPYAPALTLRHLSTMTAGLDWSESYKNPFGITAEAYYGKDLEQTMHKVKVVSKPGEAFVYQSGATQLLGLCLKAAVKQSMAAYASEKLWKPMGAEQAATWHTDHKDGLELAYCCINAASRDYARLGEVVLHRGTWNGHHFFDSSFTDVLSAKVKDPVYGQSMWLGETKGVKWFMFRGTLGQYIIVIPEKQLLIVRTGNHEKKGKRRLGDDIYTYVEGILSWKPAQ